VINLIDRFTNQLKKGKYNAATVAAYRNYVYVFYNEFRDFPQSKLTDELISDYLQDLAQRKDSKEVAVQAGKAIKLFFEMTFNRKIQIKSTGKLVEQREIHIFKRSEIQQIIRSTTNLKHKLMFCLTYNYGLSLSILLSLKPEHISLQQLTFTIPHDQTKIMTLRISPDLAQLLEIYFAKYNPQHYLFENTKQQAMTPRSVQLMFHGCLEKAGLGSDATFHTLRHSFAVHSLESGMDIHVLQSILGHKYLRSTAIYLPFVTINAAYLRLPLEEITWT